MQRDEEKEKVNPNGFTPVDPKCPECKFQPLQFNTSVMTLDNGAVVSVIWCIHCGHTLNAQCLGMQQHRIERPQLIIKN